MTHRPYQPPQHQSDYDPLPILVYCQLISHRTEVIHEEDHSYEVPEKVLLVHVYVHRSTLESVLMGFTTEELASSLRLKGEADQNYYDWWQVGMTIDEAISELAEEEGFTDLI